MANITTFRYMGEDIEIQRLLDAGENEYFQIDCGDMVIEILHPDMNFEPFTVQVDHYTEKKQRKEIGNFLAKFLIPLRNILAPGYSIYLNVH